MRPPRDKLSEGDAALWARFTQDIRPLGTRPQAHIPHIPMPRPHQQMRARDIDAPRTRATGPVQHATLDGSWEKSLASGKITPDRSIDLHGLTQSEAHARVHQLIPMAYAQGARVLLVVTGRSPLSPDAMTVMQGARPRGMIRASLSHWLDSAELRPFVAAMRPAHQKHGGKGAFYIVLRRAR